jgi:hypothetical protein
MLTRTRTVKVSLSWMNCVKQGNSLSHYVYLVSFEEFKTIFHKQTNRFAVEAGILSQESTVSESEAGLVGLDAHIPGGKYDAP